MNKMKETDALLSQAQLLKAGFKAKTVKAAKVTLSLTMRMQDKIEKYKMSLDLKACATLQCVANFIAKKLLQKEANASQKLMSEVKEMATASMEEDSIREIAASAENAEAHEDHE